MPGGDGTGPLGMGSMTGRRAGFCAGYTMPGYANPISGMGPGYGYGRGFGRGFGRGRGSGRGRGFGRGFGWAAWGAYPYAYGQDLSAAEEAEMLRQEADAMREELKGMESRVKELESLTRKEKK